MSTYQPPEIPFSSSPPSDSPHEITGYNDSVSDEDEVPESIQFESRPTETSPLIANRPPEFNNTIRFAQNTLGIHPNSGAGITTWADVKNLDVFLGRIYAYYQGKGAFTIILSEVCNLIMVVFVVFISMFLSNCIDFSLIDSKKRMDEVIIPQCYSKLGLINYIFIFFVVAACIIWILKLVLDIPRLFEMRKFFKNVFKINDYQVETTPWSVIVETIVNTRSVSLQQHNPSVIGLAKLDAHIIANRILRKDNFMIALLNKNVLDLSVPRLNYGPIFTKLIEWNLDYAIFAWVFDERGAFRKRFLKETNRSRLIDQLEYRIKMLALINLLCSPLLFVYLCVYNFFKFSEEYHRFNSAIMGSRSYSLFALWKFREFNEFPHALKKRLATSYNAANLYLSQFPNSWISVISRCVSFISGSLTTVLIVITLFEEELQKGFEITPGRSALFYIGVFGGIMAFAGSFIPAENLVFEPEKHLKQVILDTHYYPPEWKGMAHTAQVRGEFAFLFPNKYLLILQEVFSPLLAPIVLYYSLLSSAPDIVDFFRDYTVHVATLGYVCSFAVFDFKRHGNPAYGVQGGTDDDHMVSKAGKMEQSFLNFKATHPKWVPDFATGSVFPKEIQESMLQSTTSPTNYGREFVQMLDAIYDANRRNA